MLAPGVLPQPGDVVAWPHGYADATGHMAIVVGAYENPISYLDSSIVFIASDCSTVQNKIAILSMNGLSTKSYIEFAEKSLSLYEKNII